MSKIEELKKQMQELDKQRLELQHELELEEKKTETEIEYLFKDNERYWLITASGQIESFTWSNQKFDTDRYSQGHLFKTEQEAEKERAKRELLTRFRRFRDKCNGDWKPTISEKKHYIFFNFEERKFKIDWFCQIGLLDVFGCFKNEEDCERAIQLFGDEIIRLFVED